jgi:hypothetical protein
MSREDHRRVACRVVVVAASWVAWLALSPLPALAQTPAPASKPGQLLPARPFAHCQLSRPRSTVTADRFRLPRPAATRPRALVPLYAGYASLHVVDFQSTRQVQANGGREFNPLIGAVREHPVALAAVKGAITVGTIYLAERLWKTHRTRAVVAMAIVNGLYVAAAASNYSLARRLAKERQAFKD